MKRRYKYLSVVLGVLGIALVILGAVLSHDSPCGSASAAGQAPTMQAWTHRCYGGPEVLEIANVPKPVPADDEVLVKVRAASVNPLDWHYLRGTPYVMRMEAGVGAPKDPLLGVDFAGVVEAVGKSVTHFKAGDAVFGARSGAFGEYVKVRESRNIVAKPANITFAQAAAIPIAAITALQAVRDQAQLKPGEKVLINGASGGVGTFAVQFAKYYGAEVTGVCSGRNVELVKSLGADHVIDYTKEDFTAGSERYDAIIDNVGSHTLAEYRRVMQPDGWFVMVGGPNEGKWLGPLAGVLKMKLYDPFVGQQFKFFLAQITPQDLGFVAGLLKDGKLTATIDKTYPLSDVPEAIRYLETGRARGKVIITLNE